ncbi:MAG TPA: tetratricopeptide repeat protein [Holophagaceae bacterium]|nr:tetratricopeptide repeat protein [Holophagaceae bacterium]
MSVRKWLVPLFCAALGLAQAPGDKVASTPLPVAETGPFALPQEVKEFVQHTTLSQYSTQAKLRALMEAVFRSPEEGGLGMTYDNSRTRTVAEVWRDRKANCLSLTAFYVASCRAVGIPALYADSVGVNRWSRKGSLICFERHVVAVVPMPPVDNLVADFVPQLQRGVHHLDLLPENRVLALFHSNRAVELLQEHDPTAALEEAKCSLKVDEKSGVGWNILGVVQRDLGLETDAEASFLKALDLDAKDGAACGNLETLMQDTNRPELAAHYRDLGMKLRAKDPYFHAFLALEAYHGGNMESARDEVKAAIKLLPYEPDFYVLLAQLQVAKGEKDDAIKTLERAKRWSIPAERQRLDSKLALLQSKL